MRHSTCFFITITERGARTVRTMQSFCMLICIGAAFCHICMPKLLLMLGAFWMNDIDSWCLVDGP